VSVKRLNKVVASAESMRKTRHTVVVDLYDQLSSAVRVKYCTAACSFVHPCIYCQLYVAGCCHVCSDLSCMLATLESSEVLISVQFITAEQSRIIQ
jgi:hypothetical protein